MNTLMVGTRGSPLAREQTRIFCERVSELFPAISFNVQIIKTRGDAEQVRPISQMGDKSLFTKELEDALLDERIDVAVHSGKDLTAALPAGLTVGAVLPREDRADAFCSVRYKALGELPEGAKVGSGSIRRRAQILRFNSRLSVTELRGNVDTRLKKLSTGDYDAIVLAVAGLVRLGFGAQIKERLDPHIFLPAPAQGAIAVEFRKDRKEIAALLQKVSHENSFCEVKSERALLERLEAGCTIPLGAFAEVSGEKLSLTAGLFQPDGTKSVVKTLEGSVRDPVALGWEMAKVLLRSGGDSILSQFKLGAKASNS